MELLRVLAHGDLVVVRAGIGDRVRHGHGDVLAEVVGRRGADAGQPVDELADLRAVGPVGDAEVVGRRLGVLSRLGRASCRRPAGRPATPRRSATSRDGASAMMATTSRNWKVVAPLVTAASTAEAPLGATPACGVSSPPPAAQAASPPASATVASRAPSAAASLAALRLSRSSSPGAVPPASTLRFWTGSERYHTILLPMGSGCHRARDQPGGVIEGPRRPHHHRGAGHHHRAAVHELRVRQGPARHPQHADERRHRGPVREHGQHGLRRRPSRCPTG